MRCRLKNFPFADGTTELIGDRRSLTGSASLKSSVGGTF